MAFNCSILLSDIDINCNKRVTGGIKKAILALQEDVIITFNPFDETIVDAVDVSNEVSFSHNPKDGTTTFTENKNTSNGLGVVTTNITIQCPAVDNKVNKIDYMSRREDIVCILLHNNDSVTISGWIDGLTMNYEANSGTGTSEKSYVNITLNTESGIASLVLDDKTPFLDPNIFD
jgi:chaperonin GroEL (HSP60 family)